ncbi:MAG TPA: mechanosensitive ion channel family protein [Candidatus Corynebacterium gallistercoris]|uniref:Mechanosensitive ion channel family protein n=1 Tax=Candidatus Corynebacterium gallistercoris TaxID=2838530 RepID=A0A9D1RWZ1_9CORY|nr:mechanosensitive ion channel family protein [Candidatus Corynebacterium gallistercoris]
MDVSFFLFRLWEWIVDHGIPLVALLLLAILVPRIGRLAVRIIANRFNEGEEATKARLALVGALVYVLQAIAFFIIIMLALTNMGVPAMGAALPATVVSAAVGFGAQNVIGDFLAGFFIISERQFGVGDFVSFDGTSGDIEGTVVALTLRATKIRTPSGEVVMIPNGSAGVITNFSQDWSRAVVDLGIPLEAGESMDDLLTRVRSTAQEAITDEAIAGDVTGDVEILPATKLVAPTVAGQSWQVNFRTMVVVNPARQWAVERVIRSALLNAFWDRYDTPHGFGGDVPAPQPPKPQKAAPASVADEVKDEEQATKDAESRTKVIDAVPDKDDGPGAPSEVVAPVDTTDELTDDDEDTGIWRTEVYDSRVKNMMSFGGRVRPSTTGLIAALIITGGLALASSNPEGGDAGWLSPDYWRDREPTQQVEEQEPPESTTEPTYEQPATDTQSPQTTGQQSTQQPQSTPTQQPQQTQTQQPQQTGTGETQAPAADATDAGPTGN